MTAVLLAAVALAAAPQPEGWAVVGLREPGEPKIADTVELLRGAVQNELGKKGRVHGAEETRARLGLPARSLEQVKDLLDASELYFFQLELDAARGNLELALAALVHAGGDVQAYERMRVARLLLAMVELTDKKRGSKEAARKQLERLAALLKSYRPDAAAYPKELVALYAEAQGAVAAAPRGKLQVTCKVPASCKAAHVWVDTVPAGVPGESIELPAGTYQVLVTDRFEKPAARSLTRDVEVRAGATASVTVDLGTEGAVEPDGGPAFLVPADREARTSALVVAAARVGAARTVGVWRTAGDAPRVHVAVIDPSTSRVEREAHVRLAGRTTLATAVEKLARFAVAGEATDGVVAPGAPGGGKAAEPAAAGTVDVGPSVAGAPGAVPVEAVAAPPAEGAPLRPLRVAKWATGAGAVLLAGVGSYFKYEALAEQEALDIQLERWGNVVPTDEIGRVHAQLDDIQSADDMAVGLWVGAGALLTTSAVLFVLDDGP